MEKGKKWELQNRDGWHKLKHVSEAGLMVAGIWE
jgi:hypothetical protein